MKLQIASTMRTLAKPHCNNATRFTVTIICLLISHVESAATRINVPSKIAGPFRNVISTRCVASRRFPSSRQFETKGKIVDRVGGSVGYEIQRFVDESNRR